MLFVQDRNFYEKLAPPDALPAREPMFSGTSMSSVLPAERMTRQVWDLIRS